MGYLDMAKRHRHDGQAEQQEAQPAAAESPARAADTASGPPPPNEINEKNEKSSTSAPTAGRTHGRAVALERLRADISPGLARCDDDMLLGLVAWHLCAAFDRGGVTGWRRALPRVLAPLDDDAIAALIDWELLAALERAHWQTNPDAAATVSRGGVKLATWWNARRAVGGGDAG